MQAEKEAITPYLMSVRYIVRHLQYPPSQEYLALLAPHDLHATYQDAFGEKGPLFIEMIIGP